MGFGEKGFIERYVLKKREAKRLPYNMFFIIRRGEVSPPVVNNYNRIPPLYVILSVVELPRVERSE